jgi:predicted Fe-S protein YdhL (DUF1289 family)
MNWCDINPDNGFCRGCHRTLDEIAEWSTLSDEQKLLIWEKLKVRQAHTKQ